MLNVVVLLPVQTFLTDQRAAGFDIMGGEKFPLSLGELGSKDTISVEVNQIVTDGWKIVPRQPTAAPRVTL